MRGGADRPVCESIEEILALLNESQFPQYVWAAKNYRKSDLIEDLREIAGISPSRTAGLMDK